MYGEDAAENRSILNNRYWINSMVRPVMFAQAVKLASAEKGPFDIGIEYGLHPALKGPALQVVQEILGDSIPYTGLLSRGKNDKQALAEGLACIWHALDENAVDYLSFDKLTSGGKATAPQIVPNLPTYAWDRERRYLHGSRQSEANRIKPDPSRELLSTKCPDGAAKQ